MQMDAKVVPRGCIADSELRFFSTPPAATLQVCAS